MSGAVHVLAARKSLVYGLRAKSSLAADYRALLGRGVTEPAARRNWRLCLTIEAAWVWYLSASFLATYYRRDMHLNPTQILWLQMTWATILTIGTPFGGLLADRYGIRRIMLYGIAAHVVSAIVFSLCREFWQFEIALVFSGIKDSLLNGSTDTLCTASLRRSIADTVIREELYEQYQHAAMRLRSFMAPVAMVIGNYLWQVNTHLPNMLQIAINAIPLIAVWKVAEQRPQALHLKRADITKRLRVLIVDRRDIRWGIVVFVVTWGTSIVGFWSIQPLMVDTAGISPKIFGWIYAAQSVCIGLCSWIAKAVQGASALVMWGSLAIVTSLGAIGASFGGIFGVVMVLTGFSLARAAMRPFLAGYLHKTLGEDDETRSIDLSIVDAIGTAAFVLLAWNASTIVAIASTEVTFLVIGIVCATLSSIALLGLRRATK